MKGRDPPSKASDTKTLQPMNTQKEADIPTTNSSPAVNLARMVAPLKEFLQPQIGKCTYELRNFRQAGPFIIDLLDPDQPWLPPSEEEGADEIDMESMSPEEIDAMLARDQAPCSLKFRFRKEDAHANKECSIALDGIEVKKEYRRKGICTAVLRVLATSLRDSDAVKIKAVVLNPISDEMKALLDKLGVSYASGTATVWDHHFLGDSQW